MSKHTPERQAEINRKIAEHHRGRPHPHKSHPHSLETRAKISAARRQLLREGFSRKGKKGNVVGARNFQWKGGRKPAMHYYRRQAYEIAAICEGKPLRMGEVIHHNDEVKENNAPENLLVFPTNREHMHYHQQLLAFQREGREVDTIQLALKNGGRRLQRPASLIGWKPDIEKKSLLEKMDRRIAGQRILPSNVPPESRPQ